MQRKNVVYTRTAAGPAINYNYRVKVTKKNYKLYKNFKWKKSKTKIYKKIQSVEFQKMNIMGYPREYYWMPWHYDRLKSIPNILKCYEKRNRNYSENGFQLLKEI